MRFKPLVYGAVFVLGFAILKTWLAESDIEESFWRIDSSRNGDVSVQEPLQAQQFTSAADFHRWQSATRSAYQQALHFDQGNENFNARVLHRAPGENDTSIEYFEITMDDGVRVPGVLQYPRGGTQLPAVIVIPGHTPRGESGLQQLVRAEDSYQHAAASKMAAAGFATIAIELRGFGLLGMPNFPEHKIIAYNELLKGSSYKARVMADLAAVHEFLASQSFVDAARIGVAGASLGGELAVALGAALPNIKAVAFSSYIEQGAFSGFDTKRTKQPHYCHIIPGVAKFMRKEDVFKLIAPRPLFGARETSRPGQFTKFANNLSELWSLLDVPQQFEFMQVENGKHEFYVAPTIEFFKQHL